MALKRRIARLEDVEESQRSLYVKTDDGYALDLDDTSLERTLESERRQRVETTKKLQALEEKYKGLDPDKYRETQERLAALEDERLKAEGKYAELAERKYAKSMEAAEAEKAELKARIEREQSERAQLEQERADLIIEQQLKSALLELGADPKGVAYAVSLHRGKWALGDDKRTPVRRDKDGRVIGGPKDPNAPLSMKEDLTEWVKKDEFAERFFLPSSGGGANGGARPVGTVTITRADARDVRKYEAAKAQAAQSGVPLQVSE